MNKINKFLTIILLAAIVQTGMVESFAQGIEQAKTAMQDYMETWFINYTGNDWVIKVNDVRFPDHGFEVGVTTLSKNLQNAKVPKNEQTQIINGYIQTYIDQSLILSLTYEDILNDSNLDILLQEFLRQAATQIWLENQVAENPNAVEPTQEEINQYYVQNSERLLRLGLSAAQIKEYTEQELRQAKLKAWTSAQLADVRAKYPVDINPKIRRKYNIK